MGGTGGRLAGGGGRQGPSPPLHPSPPPLPSPSPLLLWLCLMCAVALAGQLLPQGPSSTRQPRWLQLTRWSLLLDTWIHPLSVSFLPFLKWLMSGTACLPPCSAGFLRHCSKFPRSNSYCQSVQLRPFPEPGCYHVCRHTTRMYNEFPSSP